MNSFNGYFAMYSTDLEFAFNLRDLIEPADVNTEERTSTKNWLTGFKLNSYLQHRGSLLSSFFLPLLHLRQRKVALRLV